MRPRNGPLDGRGRPGLAWSAGQQPFSRMGERSPFREAMPGRMLILVGSLVLALLPPSLSGTELRLLILYPDSFAYLPMPVGQLEQAEVFTLTSRVPQPRGDALAHSYLLTEEDMDDLDARGVAGILERLPGLVGLGSGYLGQPTWLSVGGVEPLVLVDGAPAVGGLPGDVDLSLVPSVSVDRVEVVREGLSSLYGSGGGAGVIDLIGKSFPGGKPFTRVGVARGTYDTQLTEVEFTRGMGERLGLYLVWNWERTQGDRQNSDSDRKYLNGDVSFELRKPARIRVQGERVERARGVPGTSESPSSTRNTATGDRVMFEIEKADMNVRVYRQEMSLDQNDPGSYESSRLVGFSLANRLDLRQHLLVVGADMREETFGGQWSGSHRRRGLGIFGQGQMQVHPLVLLVPGVRYDLPRQVSPRVSLRYCPAMELRLSGSVGRSFRSPTLRELYLNPPLQFCDSVGNPNLEQEAMVHSNIGFAYRRTGLYLQGSLFLYRVENRIAWSAEEEAWTTGNQGRSEPKGVEVDLEKGGMGGFSVGAGLLYQTVGGVPLPLAPRVSSNFRLTYRKVFREGSADLNLRLAGRYAGERVWEHETLDPYLLFGVRGEVKVADISLVSQVDNLLSERYEPKPACPMPGRTVCFGLSWEFWD